MLVTGCWKVAPLGAVGMPIWLMLVVNGSIETQRKFRGLPFS